MIEVSRSTADGLSRSKSLLAIHAVAALRSWLEPRQVRYYPSRGVTYESHLAPPPHLVGLRIAALDALLDPADQAPVVVVSAAFGFACRRRIAGKERAAR